MASSSFHGKQDSSAYYFLNFHENFALENGEKAEVQLLNWKQISLNVQGSHLFGNPLPADNFYGITYII
jgi:hypothetical protein